MAKSHLILSNASDYHAIAVKWALERLGHDVLLWSGIGESGDAHVSFVPSRLNSPLTLAGRTYASFASTWFRRQSPSRAGGSVHPDSEQFLKNEILQAHESLCSAAENISDFVVGGRSSRAASSKVRQLEVAVATGMCVPNTLISNNYEEIARFAAGHREILVKHFFPHYWGNTSSGRISAVGPCIIKDFSKINQRSVEICPAIYQELVDKKYEIRVTVIGDDIFAAKIQSRRGESFLDWRQEYGNEDMFMSAMELSGSTANSVRGLMHILNLKYGCIDFAVDQEGREVFLEINPGGQFLFVEEYVPEFRLLAAFSAMLASGSNAYATSGMQGISDADFLRSDEYLVWSENRVPQDEKGRFFTFVA